MGFWKTEPTEWCHGWVDAVDVSNAPHRGVVAADAAYITLTLRSLHVPYVRKGLTRFFGAVHCFASLLHHRGERAEFHAVTVPQKLKDVDSGKGLTGVITGSHTLLGPVPYRGDALAVEIALFSVATGDLVAPYLELLEGLSNSLGVAFINTALGVTRQLSAGVEKISKTGAGLEIGLSTEFNPPETGFYAVVRAPRDTLDLRSYRIAADGRLVDAKGALATAPNLVFSIESTPRRNGWRTIPELRDAYARLEAPVIEGRTSVVNALLVAFERTLKLSPDLLDDDASTIYEAVKKKINSLLPARATSTAKIAFPSLEEIPVPGLEAM